MPVLRRRAAGWCLANGLPEEALEYSMAAGDTAAVLMEKLVVPAIGKAGSRPSSGGLGGWRTGAASRDTR